MESSRTLASSCSAGITRQTHQRVHPISGIWRSQEAMHMQPWSSCSHESWVTRWLINRSVVVHVVGLKQLRAVDCVCFCAYVPVCHRECDNWFTVGMWVAYCWPVRQPGRFSTTHCCTCIHHQTDTVQYGQSSLMLSLTRFLVCSLCFNDNLSNFMTHFVVV